MISDSEKLSSIIDRLKNLHLPSEMDILIKLNSLKHQPYRYDLNAIDDEIKTLESRSKYKFGPNCEFCNENICYISQNLADARNRRDIAFIDNESIDKINTENKNIVAKYNSLLNDVREYNESLQN
jgi:hypothetical protein